MLPLEVIELDAFRRRHDGDTFWCGLLLGGCGLPLTTKLYTDRVCHFAHDPGPDGHPHVCGRRARGVSSADHLYVKSAAAAWLRARGKQADFNFAQPDGAPIGSVVDIQLQHGGLRVHLDQAVAPVWDGEREPVRTLLKHVKASAYPYRTDAERAAVTAAEALLKAYAKQQQDRAAARRAQQEDKRAGERSQAGTKAPGDPGFLTSRLAS